HDRRGVQRALATQHPGAAQRRRYGRGQSRIRRRRRPLGGRAGAAAPSLRRAHPRPVPGDSGRGPRLLPLGAPHRSRDPRGGAIGASGGDRRGGARPALWPGVRALRNRRAADRRRARAARAVGHRADPGSGVVTVLATWLKRSPLIAILRGVEPAEVVGIAEELIAAGILIIEVPLNSPAPIESIRRLAGACAGRSLAGAGTVMRADEVAAIRAAGGELVVAPHANAAVVQRAKELGLIAIPGFFTPSEAFAMIDA